MCEVLQRLSRQNLHDFLQTRETHPADVYLSLIFVAHEKPCATNDRENALTMARSRRCVKSGGLLPRRLPAQEYRRDWSKKDQLALLYIQTTAYPDRGAI